MGHNHLFRPCPFEMDGIACSGIECECGDGGVDLFGALLAGATQSTYRDEPKLCGFHDPKNKLWYLGELGIKEWVENRKFKQ